MTLITIKNSALLWVGILTIDVGEEIMKSFHIEEWKMEIAFISILWAIYVICKHMSEMASYVNNKK